MTTEERMKPKVKKLLDEAGLLIVLRLLYAEVKERAGYRTTAAKALKKALNTYEKWYLKMERGAHVIPGGNK